MALPLLRGSTTWNPTGLGDASLTSLLPGLTTVGDLLVVHCIGVAGSAAVTWGNFPVTSGWTVERIGDNGSNGIHSEIWSKVATATDVGAGVFTFSHGTVSSSNFILYGASWALWYPAGTTRITTGLTAQGNSGAGGTTGPITLAGDPADDKWIMAVVSWSSSGANTEQIRNDLDDWVVSNFSQDSSSAPNGIFNDYAALDNVSGQVDPAGTGSVSYWITASAWWVYAAVRATAEVAPPAVAIPARLATIVG